MSAGEGLVTASFTILMRTSNWVTIACDASFILTSEDNLVVGGGARHWVSVIASILNDVDADVAHGEW